MKQIMRIVKIPSKDFFSQTRHVNVIYIDDKTGEQGQQAVPVIPGPSEVSLMPYINWEGQVVPVVGIVKKKRFLGGH